MGTKERILEIFEKEDGNYISGNLLSERLGISRTAVWKAVNGLRKDGFMIEGKNNLGYILSPDNDILSANSIRKYLSSNKEIIVLKETDSTNEYLKRLNIEKNLPEGTSVISDFQTRGKGRLGRSFFSPRGTGLYLSLLVKPEGNVSDNLNITAKAAVAVYRAVKNIINIDTSIKWVNDLYYNGKKVCGILSEGQTSMENGTLEYVIVGIGINLYEPDGGFPEEIRKKAGFIVPKGQRINRNLFAAEIINEFFSIANEKDIPEEYFTKSCVIDKDITVIDGSDETKAHCYGISTDGKLLVRYMDGRERKLFYGEISVRTV